MSVKKEIPFEVVDKMGDLLPPATPEADEQLEMSVRAIGIVNPVIYAWTGPREIEIIDGRRRLALAESLGIECPRKILPLSTSAEERARLRVVSSIDWRGRSKSDLVAHFLTTQEAAGMSPALIAQKVRELFGIDVSSQTVRNVREELVESGQIELPERTVGADGRQRPTARPQQQRTRPPRATFTPARPVEGIDHAERDEWARGFGVDLSFLRDAETAKIPANSAGVADNLNGLRVCIQGLLDCARPDATDAERIATRAFEKGCALAQADGERSKGLTDMFRQTLDILFGNAQDLINEVNRLRRNATENNN